MKLYYRQDNGEVYYAVYDIDLFKFTHSTNVPLSIFNIDEVDPDNKGLCQDLSSTQFRFDSLGRRKYFIQSNQLNVIDNWQEIHIP